MELSEDIMVKIMGMLFEEYISTTTILSREEARRVYYTCKIDDAVKGVDIMLSTQLFRRTEEVSIE